ncbi:MAG: staygreen family protein [Dehalococcoidia bacterium]
MKRLDPRKLNVTYLPGTTPEHMDLPRRYTLTHSDRTGKLFLSIGSEFNTRQISSIYTRLMRDEALAELCDEGTGLVFKVYCHVSGGLVIGTAKWRYGILQSEMPLVLETIRYGDRVLFELEPALDDTQVLVHFASTDDRFNRVEDWGTMP